MGIFLFSISCPLCPCGAALDEIKAKYARYENNTRDIETKQPEIKRHLFDF